MTLGKTHTLMPQRTLISGSLRKKLTEGHRKELWPLIKGSSETTFHCDLEDPGDKWEVAASEGVNLLAEPEEASIK